MAANFPSLEIHRFAATKSMPKFPSLRKRLATVKSTPPRCEKSPLLRKGTMTLGVPFKRRSLTIAGASSSKGQKSGTDPPKKKAKVSEPIDLTESSSEPESKPTPSPPPAKKSPRPAKKPQPSQTPAKESQIPSGMTPERYHMEHLLTPRDFFYPRVALDFYQSMTTNQVRDPTVIHFTIDGRHGILGARYIAEALHIPFELAHLEDFRALTHPSQSDIIHTLSRGVSSRHYILRKELSPSMFFIHALLRHNIFPLQYWVQRRGVLLEALFRISEGYFFGPHHLIMATLLYFEEKIFTLNKWTSMTAYGGADQGAPAGLEEPVDIPADTQPPAPAMASSEPTPEVPPSAPQATP
uniref:Uncharacterized protein n=1 Tax=Vitis vinifera TaxID=29760 RepID=A5C5K8_VITVI|nr:hypothetical protein VITISV_037011 [Vitis vinifera]